MIRSVFQPLCKNTVKSKLNFEGLYWPPEEDILRSPSRLNKWDQLTDTVSSSTKFDATQRDIIM